ncbi:hypothetical protein [Streptomyces mirabilis]|uniref:hypothetical protein n=1 Tax=Streptomyces mirabilis TaxID=68239 RepID=UPI0033A3DC52
MVVGQVSARERGRHGGRPKVIDDHQIDCARKLVISTGNSKVENPSVATVYLVLAEADADTTSEESA